MHFNFIRHAIYVSIFMLVSACQNNDTQTAETTDQAASQSDPIAELEKSIRVYPDSMLLFARLSDLQEQKGDPGDALATLEKGLLKDSTAVILINRRASLMLGKGDTAAAITGLLKSLRYAPEQTDIHIELGFLYAAQRRNNALVVADFLLTQTDQPKLLTQARYMKGIYYANVGDTRNALLNFNECIINDYTFVDAYMEKGILLYNEKKYADALKVFEKVMAISNTHAEAYFWTGKCLEAIGKKEEAIDYYKKTLGLDEKVTAASEAINRLTGTGSK
jgi:tetratricopeptide (TPR) repeat protein